MAEYNTSFNTSLGDYLKYLAAKNKISIGELETKVEEIVPIRVKETGVLDAVASAIEEFNRIANQYHAVVELKEGVSEVGWWGMLLPRYTISGTAIRFKKQSIDNPLVL